MKNKSLRIKILSGMLCTGLAFSSTGLTFASVKNNGGVNNMVVTSVDFKGSAKNKMDAKERYKEMRVTLEVVIKESIASKVITQTEGEKVLAYVNAKSTKNPEDFSKDKQCKRGKCDGPKGGLFNELVREGILTQEKSDALRKKIYAKNTEIRTMELKKGLANLVVNKVITTDQSNKVQQAITARHAEGKEIYKKMKDMSEAERKAYIEKMDSTRISPMKALIENGTITKEQEIEIQKVLPQRNHGHHGYHGAK